jgi:hypothetical protein
VVDISKLDRGAGSRLRPGSSVTVVGVPVGENFQAVLIKKETGTSESPPAKPAQPPVQVVYPTGKYVLYGDGVNQAYRWVWMQASPPVSPPTPPQ